MDFEGGAEPGGRFAQWTAVGVLAQAFPVDLLDRVIDQYWRREQRIRALPTRLVFYFVLALCLFPQESYRSMLKILMGAFGRPTAECRVPALAAIVKARRRLGSEPWKQSPGQ
ncbi:transposase domain-containing protein [Pseudonocardia sp. T1-2H]|uniref:transposase domain-containing protein n=1 Tax=Pseudonocardia sp. T1-2H TaxID=3128899 RepID=UPI003101A70E